MRTRGAWLPVLPRAGEAGGAMCAVWVTDPDGPIVRDVLLLPPVGYEYSSAHRFLRSVAERLAADGARVLRLDYWGTGDSAGGAEEIVGLGPWRQSVQAAARWLREQGAATVAVLGVQLGAMLALLDLEQTDPDALVLVAPALSGRRFVRGLSVLAHAAPDEVGGLSAAGSYLSAGLLAELSTVSATVPERPATLIVEDSVPEVAAFLQRPAEDATAPQALVDRIAVWVADTVGGSPRAAGEFTLSDEASAPGPGEDNTITGRIVALGPSQLVGVATTSSQSDGELLLVLINSGSDPHTGPGRAWVELARRLAADGLDTLRVDMRGWGESPDHDPRGGPRGEAVPGRPYDQHCLDDVAELIEELRGRGRRLVLAGLCAGAWIALSAARTLDVAGVVALNPQLYWQPGDPVEALMSDTRERRLPEIARIQAAAQDGVWDAEDAQGLRPPAGQWLDDLVERGRPVSLLFAEGDDGIEYLRERLGRRLAEAVDSGVLDVEELPDIDHGMHRWWLRPVVFDAVERRLRALAAPEPA